MFLMKPYSPVTAHKWSVSETSSIWNSKTCILWKWFEKIIHPSIVSNHHFYFTQPVQRREELFFKNCFSLTTIVPWCYRKLYGIVLNWKVIFHAAAKIVNFACTRMIKFQLVLIFNDKNIAFAQPSSVFQISIQYCLECNFLFLDSSLVAQSLSQICSYQRCKQNYFCLKPFQNLLKDLCSLFAVTIYFPQSFNQSLKSHYPLTVKNKNKMRSEAEYYFQENTAG